MEFDTIYQGLINGEEKLALVGLGYVGMPLAVDLPSISPSSALTSTRSG